MDAPPIQYCKTSDGVRIAYWTMGQGGTPLILSSPVVYSHISLELREPRMLALYERLSASRMIVRYDPRNMGTSQRGVTSLMPEDLASDVIAVADALGVHRCDLLGISSSAFGVVAALWPDRVRRLVLAQTPVSYVQYFEQLDAVFSLAEKDWDLFLETMAHATLGWTSRDAHAWAQFVGASIRQEDWLRGFNSGKELTLAPYLPKIMAETLIVRSDQKPIRTPGEGEKVASLIANAQL